MVPEKEEDETIEIILAKQSFKPGEKLKGKVRLRLGSKKKARALRIEFFGERMETHKHFSGKYSQTHTANVVVYHEQQNIGSAKTYRNGDEIAFVFTVPKDAILPKHTEVVAKALGEPTAKPDWFVRAWLDLPMAFDITAKISVDIKGR